MAGIEFNPTDEILLHKRVEMLIRMEAQGMINPREFCDLFEMQKTPNVIEEERTAYENPNSSYEDSSYGRLLQQFLRMGGDFSVDPFK